MIHGYDVFIRYDTYVICQYIYFEDNKISYVLYIYIEKYIIIFKNIIKNIIFIV